MSLFSAVIAKVLLFHENSDAKVHFFHFCFYHMCVLNSNCGELIFVVDKMSQYRVILLLLHSASLLGF